MVMRLEPLLLALYKSNLLKCYFLIIIILLENDIFNCSDKAHFYFTYDLKPMIFQSCYPGDGNTFKKNTIIKNQVNLQNIFIHHCFYCLHIFHLEKKCTRWVHFIFTLNQFHFILSEQIFISQRSRIITFPFTHPYFSSSFPLSFFNPTLPPKRNCSN